MNEKPWSIPSLDGLRGTAALIVFVAHAGMGRTVPGGFGVTVFFFLSGYLITTLLRREYDAAGSISLSRFYARRALRLFPPLYAVLAGILLYDAIVGGVGQPSWTTGGLLSQVFYWTNYYYILFGKDGLVPQTSIYWSLAVEEHFYLIFPVAFIWMMSRSSGARSTNSYGRVARMLAIACAVSLAWRLILMLYVGVGESYTYRASDSRFDSILFGCILGVWHNPMLDRTWSPSRMQRYALLGTALAALLLTFAVRDELFRGTVRYSIQGLALFVVFWLAVKYPTWWPFHWLNTSVMSAAGKISYTFYLTHLFFIYLASQILTGSAILRVLLAFLMTVAFSTAMYHLLERPLALWRLRLHSRGQAKKKGPVAAGSAEAL